MSYRIHQTDSVFFFAKDQQEKGFETIKEELLHRFDHDVWTQSKIKETTTMPNLLEFFDWQCTIDKDENITDISFIGETGGTEYCLFDVIAPYIKEDSFVEMRGEDGELWRYVFKNGQVIYKEPEIKW